MSPVAGAGPPRTAGRKMHWHLYMRGSRAPGRRPTSKTRMQDLSAGRPYCTWITEYPHYTPGKDIY